MKANFPALILLLTATASQASALQVETRAFHSNLRLDMKSAVLTMNGQDIGTQEGGEYFQNTAGGGIALVANLDPYVSLGLGYDRARYFPSPDYKMDQQMLSLFTRWTLYQGESSRLHFLTGVSQHRLSGQGDPIPNMNLTVKYSPVMNYDLGLGQTWTFGSFNVGLAYKYSDTFGRGNSQVVMRSRFSDKLQLTESESKTKIRNFNIEQQELSLQVGVNI